MSFRIVPRLASLALLLAGCATTSNQVPPRQGTSAPAGQDARLAIYNVTLGAVLGGVGAVINGEDGSRLRRLARGSSRGAAGGAVAYGGKWVAGEISRRENLAWGWPARLTHDLGSSIIENATHDRPPLDRVATHLGFVRVDVRPTSGSVRARLLPVNALVFGLILAQRDSELALGRSLLFGAPLFSGDGRESVPFGGASNGRAILGSVFVRRDDDEFYDTAAHELVHVMQHHELTRAETSLRAPLDPSPAVESGLERWVYLDSPLLMGLAYYAVEGGDIDAPCKYDNWLEREAEAFASRRPVGVCP